MVNILDMIIDNAVGVIVASVMFPVAFVLWFTANQDGWSAETIVMWNLIPFVVVLVLFIAFILLVRKGKK